MGSTRPRAVAILLVLAIGLGVVALAWRSLHRSAHRASPTEGRGAGNAPGPSVAVRSSRAPGTQAPRAAKDHNSAHNPTTEDDDESWFSPEERASEAAGRAEYEAYWKARGVNLAPGQVIVLLPRERDPKKEIGAEPEYMDVILCAESSRDGTIAKLWDLYNDGHHARFQGQILVRIGVELWTLRRFDEAVHALQMAIDLHPNDMFIDRDIGEESGFRNPSGLPSEMTPLLYEREKHYTEHPDSAGEWARLGLAQVHALQGRTDLARTVWSEMVAQDRESSFRAADHDLAVKLFDWDMSQSGNLAQIYVYRPVDIALEELKLDAVRRGDLQEAYRLARIGFDRVASPLPDLACDVARFAYSAGASDDALSILDRGMKTCDTLIARNPQPPPPHDYLEDWGAAPRQFEPAAVRWQGMREFLAERKQAIRSGQPWPVAPLFRAEKEDGIHIHMGQ